MAVPVVFSDTPSELFSRAKSFVPMQQAVMNARNLLLSDVAVKRALLADEWCTIHRSVPIKRLLQVLTSVEKLRRT